MARKTKLTKELIAEVCDTIRLGAYDWVACEKAGISASTFYLWLQQADAGTDDSLLLEFSESVAQAKADARSQAEIAVLKEAPSVWLLKGPGRHKPDKEGWSNENVLTLQQGTGPIKLTWGDEDGNTITDVAQITATDQE